MWLTRRQTSLGTVRSMIAGAVSALDLFVEENLVNAQRLIAAGVPTEVHVAPRDYHGFDLMLPTAAVSVRSARAWKDAHCRGLRAA